MSTTTDVAALVLFARALRTARTDVVEIDRLLHTTETSDDPDG